MTRSGDSRRERIERTTVPPRHRAGFKRVRQALFPLGRWYGCRFRHRGSHRLLTLVHPTGPAAIDVGIRTVVPFNDGLRLEVDTTTWLGWYIYFRGAYRPQALAAVAGLTAVVALGACAACPKPSVAVSPSITVDTRNGCFIFVSLSILFRRLHSSNGPGGGRDRICSRI